jgi:hypothetical protein
MAELTSPTRRRTSDMFVRAVLALSFSNAVIQCMALVRRVFQTVAEATPETGSRTWTSRLTV